jgi:phage replication O-like protein O
MSQTAQIIQLHDQLRERRPRVKADTDDGWFKVSNVLGRAECCLDLGKYEQRIYNTVKIKTYGYRKSFDYISGSQYEEQTSILPDGSHRKGVPAKKAKEIEKRLIERKILKQEGRKVAVNTIVSEWIYEPLITKKSSKASPNNASINTPIENKITPIAGKNTPIAGKKYPHSGVHNKKDNNNKIITKDIVRKPDVNPVCSEVISYLNDKAGKHFKNTPTNHKFINARIKEGHSITDLKIVIDRKTIEWKQDPKMNAYLRPSTLFNSEKFESYLGTKTIRNASVMGSGMDWNDTSWAENLNGDGEVNLI